MSVKQRKNSIPRGRPWQPGQSGNPKGRPKGRDSMAATLRELLDEPYGGGRVSKRRAVAEKLFVLCTAKRASVPALRLLVERADVDDLEARVEDLVERLDRLEAEAAERRGPALVKGGTA